MLESKFAGSLKVAIISSKKEAEIFHPIEQGWTIFHKEYPDSKGMFELSRVAFDENRTKALVYYGQSCGVRCGAGWYVLLVKVDNKWTISKQVNAWII